MSTNYERVVAIVSYTLGVDADRISESSSFIDDLGADSLDVIELIMGFEEEFDTEVSDKVAETWLTVKDAVRFADKVTSS